MHMDQSVIERVKLIAFSKEKSVRQFAEKIGFNYTTLNNYFTGKRTTIDSSLLTRIVSAYEDVSSDWLLSGEGQMVFASGGEAPRGAVLKGVPYYENVEATCGIVAQYSDYPEMPTFFINYEHFNDCTAYIPVVGDSMYPQYCAGEIVAVKRIFNMDIIQWGEAYFVVTNDNANSLKTIKQVHWCEDLSKIVLRASNPNFKGDTVIRKEDILSIFIIKGKIKRNQL